jgi:hypothetical protein
MTHATPGSHGRTADSGGRESCLEARMRQSAGDDSEGRDRLRGSVGAYDLPEFELTLSFAR